jgi:hypothetical protein
MLLPKMYKSAYKNNRSKYNLHFPKGEFFKFQTA